MHVRLPFAYSHDYFNIGGRKLSSSTFYDWIEGEVEEVSAEQAPVAIRWQENRFGFREFHPVEVRYSAGRFFVPGVRDRFGEQFETMKAGDLTEPNGPHTVLKLMAGGEYGRFMTAVTNAFQGKANPKLPTPSSIELDLGDTMEVSRNAAERKIDGLLVVDGTVWVRVDEPVLVNYADDPLVAGPKIHHGISLQEPTFQTFGAPPNFAAHRIDRTDRWEAYRQPVGKERLQVEARHIEVLLPDAFVFDEERNAMRRAVEAVLELIGPDAWQWDRERIERFLKIRDRFQVHLDNPAVEPIEDILESIPDFLVGLHPRHERHRAAFAGVKYAASLEPSINLDFGRLPS
ncbi:hypothetical protein OIU34_19030 [Pararhizobium sp. BT-229]|uniref:hypothetical protein n=1 Tax=Pararhizobium sp. BT-229 TaxID=2986923 RepID=UPI0021F70CF2|nr:hypothetical protein [Pararhizobium sp. BT-229]MCV9963976.1 hypothetical protein [Pararhizobium sp. BT-229]